MRLTVYTDYSLRMLMYLAVHSDPMPTIGEIAAAFRISRNHLMKVAHELGRLGYIETVRGKKGGLRLARPPAEIRLGDVVRRTEPDFTIVPCFEPQNPTCVLSPECRLHSALAEAKMAFLQVLDRQSLTDMVANRAALERLLDRPSAAMAARRGFAAELAKSG